MEPGSSQSPQGDPGSASARRTGRGKVLAAFVGLALLTALELAVVRIPGIARPAAVVALVGLAVTKAAVIGLFFMHLRHETRVLRLTVFGPLAAPAVYAVVLMADAAWRLLR